MLISVASHLTDDNRKNVEAVMSKYGVTTEAMVDYITGLLTSENIVQGRSWYREAYGFATGLAYGISVSTAAGVISALSPRMPWERNKDLALKMVDAYYWNPDFTIGELVNKTGGALRTNLFQAAQILMTGDVDGYLTGIKRRSFYNSIVTAGQSDDVTVDVWMARVPMAVSTQKGMDLDFSGAFLKARNHSGYVAVANAVRVVAANRGLSPATTQAASWIALSGSINGSKG